MSNGVLNSRFLTRLLTSGEEDIERVSVLKEDILSTACEPTMLILSLQCDLFDYYIFNYKNHYSNVGQYILVHFPR